MTPTKQTVYVPVKVEDRRTPEFYRDRLFLLRGEVRDVGDYMGDNVFYSQTDTKTTQEVTQWLSPQEGYFFTPEQLNEYTKEVIKEALATAAEKAKVVEEELGDNELRETPISTFQSHSFTADKGYEECSYYRYTSSKESITNTFEQTFNKFKL